MNPEIEALEKEYREMGRRLSALRKLTSPAEAEDHVFETLTGPKKLSELFAGKTLLFAINNMGVKCRYCTLWADGFNGILPHLESRFAVMLFSKDSPEEQHRFANSRGWRFRMASHGGGPYDDGPGLACYELREGKVFLKNKANFGPGDDFCAMWSFLSLAGIGTDEWVPQYSYWKKPAPEEMEDGGQDCCC